MQHNKQQQESAQQKGWPESGVAHSRLLACVVGPFTWREADAPPPGVCHEGVVEDVKEGDVLELFVCNEEDLQIHKSLFAQGC